ncbi:hypothetical protein JZK55_17060 [Dissulfurispira thermophila]|uniref:Uncharacterized protein n=1 Tax=Dissulfurispira thermophila TaxID=2715679 RepID=A0A7G1H1W6_9BACT|nr:hypothetical protein [Dissulfurispira thermophila]BCB96784.1 hypothetical protein JZK55_17060 [Dissulfurispira thermophila]
MSEKKKDSPVQIPPPPSKEPTPKSDKYGQYGDGNPAIEIQPNKS